MTQSQPLFFVFSLVTKWPWSHFLQIISFKCSFSETWDTKSSLAVLSGEVGLKLTLSLNPSVGFGQVSLSVCPLIALSVKIEKSYRFYLLCLKVLWCCIDICIELLLFLLREGLKRKKWICELLTNLSLTISHWAHKNWTEMLLSIRMCAIQNIPGEE